MERYFSGQGSLYLGDRLVGWNDLLPLGNCPEFRIDAELEMIEHSERMTGLDAVDKVFPIFKRASVTIALENTKAQNWEILLQSDTTDAIGYAAHTDTVTAVGDGRAFSLLKKNVSHIVSITNGGITYTPGTDYVHKAPSGIVYVPEGSAMSAPDVGPADTLTVNYWAGNTESIGFLVGDNFREYYLYFDGINRAENKNPVVVEAYRALFKPAELFELINESVSQRSITGSLIYDAGNQASGGYFKITQTTA